jgi:hypothetical protein
VALPPLGSSLALCLLDLAPKPNEAAQAEAVKSRMRRRVYLQIMTWKFQCKEIHCCLSISEEFKFQNFGKTVKIRQILNSCAHIYTTKLVIDSSRKVTTLVKLFKKLCIQYNSPWPAIKFSYLLRLNFKFRYFHRGMGELKSQPSWSWSLG